MLIAQITDVHLGFDADNPEEDNARRLAVTLEALEALDISPDLLLATGDLADKGTRETYLQIKSMLAPLGIPILPALGNHDRRAAFASVFPDMINAGGFVQYAWMAGDLRLLVLDTLDEGRHGGAFCAGRASWLRAQLDAAPDQPTVLVLHHPPIESGIGWMTTDPREPWVARLRAAIAGHRNIVGMIAGHVHRPMFARFAGIPLCVCPAVAPAVALAYAPVDPTRPDGRAMIVAEPPGFALHRWNGTDLVSHICTATRPTVLARYDAAMWPLVRGVFDERPSKR